MEKSNQDKQRDIIQSRALISSKKVNHLVLEWSTGCGKTLASIKIIKDIIDENPRAFGYIICKESTHRKSWNKDIEKHGFNEIIDHTDILLYASLKKMKLADFVILDECHALTEKRMEYVRANIGPHTKIIYLSATITPEKKYLVSRISKHKAKYYSITLLDAISMGLLPEPRVIIHKQKLLDGDKRKHKFLMTKGLKAKSFIDTCNYSDRWNVFNRFKNVQLTVMCNELEYYNLISDQIQYFQDKSLTGEYLVRQVARNRALNLASKRKQFLASTKTSKAKKLIKEFRMKGNRFICFTGSIEQVEELGSNNAVHSKNKKGRNSELVDCFNTKDCNELFTVNMLRESVNLTDIEKGIVVQLDSTIGSFYQMLGRCLRHKFPEIHLLIIEDTQDEVYFASAMKDFDKKFIKEWIR